MTAAPLEQMQCQSFKECEEWYNLFRAYDTDNDGYIPTNYLQSAIRDSAYTFGLSNEEANDLLFDVDSNKDQLVDFPEFSKMMARAKRMHMRRFMLYAASSVLPRSQQTESTRYLLQYNCFPPPVFMILISVVQVAIYLFYAFDSGEGIAPTKPVPVESPLILNPYRKSEVWRFVTYMFVHVGYVHILTNVAVQVMLGIPLELVHKFWRIGLIYLLGVISGALLFSVFERRIYLAGASGGVYALLSAHVANVALNWGEMEFNWIRAVILGTFVSADVAVAIYQRYFEGVLNKTSYVSHLGGFIAGLLLGIVILRNLRKKEWEKYAWWVCLVLFIFYVLVCAVMILAPKLF